MKLAQVLIRLVGAHGRVKGEGGGTPPVGTPAAGVVAGLPCPRLRRPVRASAPAVAPLCAGSGGAVAAAARGGPVGPGASSARATPPCARHITSRKLRTFDD